MQFDEGPPPPSRIGEPDSQRNLFDRFAATLQTQPRSFDAQALDCLGSRFSGFAPKGSSELSQTKTRESDNFILKFSSFSCIEFRSNAN